MDGNPVHRRRHPMLPYAIADIAARKIAAADVPLVFGLGVVRRSQIGRAADELGHHPSQRVEDRAGGLPGRDFGIRLAEVVAHLRDGSSRPDGSSLR